LDEECEKRRPVGAVVKLRPRLGGDRMGLSQRELKSWATGGGGVYNANLGGGKENYTEGRSWRRDREKGDNGEKEKKR